MQPLISILIPVYNGAPYIEQCLDSVISQSYQNIEILVSDNCSTDNTVDLIKSPKYTHVRLLVKDDNIGFQKNVHSLISTANGDYAIILCADDFWHSDDLLSSYVTNMNNDNIAFQFSSIKYLNEFNNSTYIDSPNYPSFLDGKNFFSGAMATGTPMLSCVLFNLKHAVDSQIFRENMDFSPDVVAWFKLSLLGNVIYNDGCFATYRWVSTNLTNSMTIEHKYDDEVLGHHIITNFAKDKLSQSEIDSWYVTRHNVINILYLVRIYKSYINDDVSKTKVFDSINFVRTKTPHNLKFYIFLLLIYFLLVFPPKLSKHIFELRK
ncbi:MAG: glycosyltransferase [Candidatus Cloacimonetes bacterium]|nr:glycosyltransferase [Candidatus Cloacimonadota bacterium]